MILTTQINRSYLELITDRLILIMMMMMMITMMMMMMMIIIIIIIISGTTALSGLWLLGFSPIRLNSQVFIPQFLRPALLLLLFATPIRFSLALSARPFPSVL